MGAKGGDELLEPLRKEIMNCKKCRLWKTARYAVPGEGPSDARAMLVGQNPGSEEDKTGRPFVGRSGTFLDKTLEKLDIERNDLFITNIVKHKTPENRKPRKDEIEACKPFLIRQIKAINPDIMVLMGKVAWKTPNFEGITQIKTYHPAAAMRFPSMREKFEKDFQRFRTFYLKRRGP